MKIDKDFLSQILDLSVQEYVNNKKALNETPEEFKFRCYLLGVLGAAERRGYEVCLRNKHDFTIEQFEFV